MLLIDVCLWLTCPLRQTAQLQSLWQSKGPKVLDGPSDCGEGEKMALLLGVEAGLTIIVSPVKGFCGFWTRVLMVGRPSNTALS